MTMCQCRSIVNSSPELIRKTRRMRCYRISVKGQMLHGYGPLVGVVPELIMKICHDWPSLQSHYCMAHALTDCCVAEVSGESPFTKSLGMRMIYIGAGSFDMGDHVCTTACPLFLDMSSSRREASPLVAFLNYPQSGATQVLRQRRNTWVHSLSGFQAVSSFPARPSGFRVCSCRSWFLVTARFSMASPKP